MARVAILLLWASVAAADPKLMPAADLVGTSLDAGANDRVRGYDDTVALGVPLPRWSGGGGALTFTRIGTNIFDDDGDEFHLHSYAVGGVGGQSLGHGLILGGGATVTYASALDRYNSDAWQLMVNGSVSWTRGDSDGFIVGAVYESTNTLWIPLIPILGWVHQTPGSPWHFDILLPRGIRIDRAIDDSSSIGGIIDVTGGSWLATTMDGTFVTARKVRETLAVRYQHKIIGPLRIDVRLGMMLEELDMPTEMSSTSTLPIRPAAYGQFGLAAGP